jgi:tetratricopeptide (TPR) repeat protein
MSEDWFRNRIWDEAIERRFNEKLHRARRKAQYLRIQAGMLARSHPEVALKLLDRYFSLDDKLDHAQAHVDRARAWLSLGRTNDAIESYKAALAREVEFPNSLTMAFLDLPYIIATRRVRDRYKDARELLGKYQTRLMFPVDHFRWNAAQALIAAECSEVADAREHAQKALAAANLEHSGFRYHAGVGLVTDQYDGVIESLKRLCS